jgi:CRP/FNR family cyclic AMP-dependent transcriptional regulator
MTRKPLTRFNPKVFLATVGQGKSLRTYPIKETIFSQGNAADAVFYLQEGQVKLSVVSSQGKEAVLSLLEPGDFLGKGVLPAS